MSLKKIFSLLLIVLAIFTSSTIAVTYRSDLPAEELMQKYVLPASGWMMFQNQNIHFTDEGVGNVVFLIHGTSSSLQTWDEWTQNLSKTHRVIRIDLPGFGLSGPNPQNDYSESMYLEVFEKLREALNVAKWTVVGNSFGGRLAAAYAEKHPSRTRGLVLINASGWEQKDSGFNIFDLAKGPLGSVLVKCSPKFLVKNTLSNVYADPSKVTQELVDRHYDLILFPGNRLALRSKLNTSYSTWDADKSKKMTLPVLFLWGEQDPWFSVETGQSWANSIPNAHFESMPNSGHVPMEEEPKKSLDLFLQWESSLP